MVTKALKVKCCAKNKQGKPCNRWAIRGATVCQVHGGAAKKVKANAAIRVEAMNWGLGDSTIDPGEFLLRLVSQSSHRCARYAEELQALVDAEGLAKALTGVIEVPSKYGSYAQGEYVRALAQLEADERDRGANFASKAIAAGLNERMVRVAERQGEMLAAIVTTALAEVSLPPELATALKASIARQVRELAS